MSLKTIKIKISGLTPLMQHSDRASNPLSAISKEMKLITGKRKKTDEDHIALADLHYKAGIYWDDKVGVYIPDVMIKSCLAGVSHGATKLAKKNFKASVFIEEEKIKLHYNGINKIKKLDDLVKDDFFRDTRMGKLGTSKVIVTRPIFQDWWAEFSIEFDDEVINKTDLKNIIYTAGKMAGLGAYRPDFGRFKFEEVK